MEIKTRKERLNGKPVEVRGISVGWEWLAMNRIQVRNPEAHHLRVINAGRT